MFRGLVGLTAIEVSLCGPTDGSVQSVLTFDALDVAVVQIAVPVLTAGAVPKTASVTGAGAFITFVKLTGCGLSSPATATGWPTAKAETAATISNLSLTTSSSFSLSRAALLGALLNPTRRTCHSRASGARSDFSDDVVQDAQSLGNQ